MLVRILYAAVTLSILGAFPRGAYRTSDGQPQPAAITRAAGPGLAFLQAASGVAPASPAPAESCPAR